MSTCRSCGQKIKWIKTKKGKNIPVDEESLTSVENAEMGDFLITKEGDVFKVSEKTRPDLEGYISHFSTCPDGNTWRKK